MEYLVALGFLAAGYIYLKDRQKRQGEAQTDDFNAALDAARQKLLKGGNQGSLPVLDPGSHGYRPTRGEHLIAVQEQVRSMEYIRTGRYSSRGHSVSIPVIGKLRYRVGTTAVHAHKDWQVADEGRLLATDKAIVFEGSSGNERLTWSQIAGVNLLTDGYEVERRSGKPRLFTADVPNPHFAAVLDVLQQMTSSSFEPT